MTQSLKLAYGGFSALVPANQISKLLKVPGVAAVQRDKLNKLQTVVQEPWQFVGSEDGLAIARRPAERRLERDGRRPRHRHLAGEPDARRQRNDPGAGGRARTPVSSATGSTRCTARRSPATTSSSGRTSTSTTYLAVLGAAPGEFCVGRRRSVLGARLRGPRHPHRDDRRGRLRRPRVDLRHRPRPDVGHRARGARHRLPRLPGAGMLRLGQRRRRRAGHRRRGRTS